MGKGNFILGTGSSSIGDVTFSRRNGQQIARVRVRKIKNPKSYGQAEQRMIAAEVVKFYSPLSGVLETSFEGLNKSESYAKFLSVNMNLARANGWGAEKGTVLPFPYQVAEGTLPSPDVEGAILAIANAEEGQTVNTFGALSSLLIAQYPALQEGDQVTVIGWNQPADSTVWTPTYTRFFINTESIEALPSTFDARLAGSVRFSFGSEAVAVIFSRWSGDKWLRSRSFVGVSSDYLDVWVTPEKYEAAIASYMKGAGRTPVSDVYLNGNDD